MTNTYDLLPIELKEQGYFCTWHLDTRDGKQSKVTYSKTNDKSTFTSFDKAMQSKKQDEGLGIGLFDYWCGIDIDHCISEDEHHLLSSDALDIINTIGSYCEISPSKTGIHIIFRCKDQHKIDKAKYYTKMNKDQLIKNGYQSMGGLELYQGVFDNRYLTITGDCDVDGNTNQIKWVEPKTIDYIVNKYMKRPIQEVKQREQKIITSSDNKTDIDFIEIGLTKDTKFFELWNSTPSGSGGNESETDQALMDKLAYWSNKNQQVMIEYFEKSPYFNKKDAYHTNKWLSREDYQTMTISNAINNVGSRAIDDNAKYLEEYKRKQSTKSDTYDETINNDTIEQYNQTTSSNYLEWFKDIENQIDPTIPTGWRQIDEKLKGGLRCGLYTIGAISSIGKTTFTLQLADHLALDHDVLYFSLEMTKKELISKSLSRLSFILSKNDLDCKGITPLESLDFMLSSEYKKLSNNRKTLYKASIESYKANIKHLHIIEKKTGERVTPSDISKAIDKHIKLTGNRPIVFVDYLQMLKCDDEKILNDKMAMDDVIEKLKTISRKYQIALIVISSFNRMNYDQQVSFSSFKESGSIEYTSDIVMGIQYEYLRLLELKSGTKQKEYLQEQQQLWDDNKANKKENVVTIKILKNRTGLTSKGIDFNLINAYNYFEPTYQGIGEINMANYLLEPTSETLDWNDTICD